MSIALVFVVIYSVLIVLAPKEYQAVVCILVVSLYLITNIIVTLLVSKRNDTLLNNFSEQLFSALISNNKITVDHRIKYSNITSQKFNTLNYVAAIMISSKLSMDEIKSIYETQNFNSVKKRKKNKPVITIYRPNTIGLQTDGTSILMNYNISHNTELSDKYIVILSERVLATYDYRIYTVLRTIASKI